MDSIRALTDQQLASWRSSQTLADAHLYLFDQAGSREVEVSKLGDYPSLSEDELKALLERAAQEQERPGFEVDLSGRRGHVYPLKQDTVLQGIWLVFPDLSREVDWAGLTRDSQRFSQELFAIRQSGPSAPPTFRQLVEAFPDEEDAPQPETPALHWERSQSRVVVEVEDELSACLLVDYLPIF